MNCDKAADFIKRNARPLDKAIYRYFFEKQGSKNVIKELIKYQNADGGFDITWQWHTPYAEFEQACAWWRPRITIDKLLYYRNFAQQEF